MERLLVIAHTSEKEDHFQDEIALVTDFVRLYDMFFRCGIKGGLMTAHLFQAIVLAGAQEIDEFARGVLRIEFDLYEQRQFDTQLSHFGTNLLGYLHKGRSNEGLAGRARSSIGIGSMADLATAARHG